MRRHGALAMERPVVEAKRQVFAAVDQLGSITDTEQRKRLARHLDVARGALESARNELADIASDDSEQSR